MTTPTTRTRRSVLAAAAGGAAGHGSASLAFAEPVLGADGGPVILGTTNSETRATRVERPSSSASEATFVGVNRGPGIGLHGEGGGAGVFGLGPIGVLGFAVTPGGIAVSGQANADATGVRGLSNSGQGVRGISGTGEGVYGTSPSGAGVHGHSPNGIGVRADSDGGSGLALSVEGPVVFRSSGLTTIPATASSVVVTPSLNLTGKEKVLVTLMGNPGPALVRYVGLDSAADTFTVFLTAAVPADVSLAWFVIN